MKSKMRRKKNLPHTEKNEKKYFLRILGFHCFARHNCNKSRTRTHDYILSWLALIFSFFAVNFFPYPQIAKYFSHALLHYWTWKNSSHAIKLRGVSYGYWVQGNTNIPPKSSQTNLWMVIFSDILTVYSTILNYFSLSW